MLSELKEAKKYLGARFGYGEMIPAGTYSIPTKTSKGDAFMSLIIKDDGSMSGFKLFWDESLECDWNDPNTKEVMFESSFSKAFRVLMECPIVK